MNEDSISKTGFWINPEQQSHAYFPDIQKIINPIVEKNKPKLIYDFGCGFGEYIKDINDKTGIECIGFEGMPDKRFYKNINKSDLSSPMNLKRKSDISISLEVGEHIPAEYENIFIDNICNNTKNIIILSWAIVGQTGDGHVNCRNNDYIIESMKKRNFIFDPKILQIRKAGDIKWFHNSLMLFKKKN